MKHLIQNLILIPTLVAAALASAPAMAQKAKVRVGIEVALTGPISFAGVPVKKGMEIALEELKTSAEYPDFEIEPLFEDNGPDKSQAIALTQRFAVRDKAIMILGPIGTSEALAIAPIANEQKISAITVAVSEDVLKAGPWSFKIYQSPVDVMESLSEYAVDKVKIKRAFVAFMRDADSYVIYKNAVVNYLKRRGIEVVGEASALSTDSDFSSIGTKIAAANPDALFLATLPATGANIVLQARQAGARPDLKLFGGNTLATATFTKIGGDAVNGTVIPADYFAGTQTDINKKFVNAYRAKFNEDPDLYNGVGYNLIKMAAESIKRAGGAKATREGVRQALGGLKDWPTVLGLGKFSMDADRKPTYGITILKFDNGKMVPAN